MEPGAIPPRYTERLEGEAAVDPEELFAKKLKDNCPQTIAVAHRAGTFFITVPSDFSRKELVKLGFAPEDCDRIHREDTPNSWIVTGTSDATALGAANIWPTAGQVVAKGFEKAMALQNKAFNYCVIEKIASGTNVPTPHGRDISIIPITGDKTVLVLSEQLVKERLPDIFPQRQVG